MITASLSHSCTGAPEPSLRRGACPSIATPMQTGDGLLVRLRPQAPGLSPAAWSAIAHLARRHGNGLLEVTARGNLQIRGLAAESVAGLARGLDEAGIVLRTGVVIETPPLAGLDPDEIADATPLADALSAAIARHRPVLALAPKFSIIVDGGGRLDLSRTVADLRLDAVRKGEGAAWRVSIAGDAYTAATVGIVPQARAVREAIRLLERLAAIGPTVRGRDLRRTMGLGPAMSGTPPSAGKSSQPVGVIDIGGRPVLGLRLPYGQTVAERLDALMRYLDRLGATEVRLSPYRALLVLGLESDAVIAARAGAGRLGFWADPHAPGNAISACAGSAGCASAHIDTHAVADALITAAPALLKGAADIHVSGCRKGCAHPAAAALALVGCAEGLRLVVQGRAVDEAAIAIASDEMDAAFTRLGRLVESERRNGESTEKCLERLGGSRLHIAYQGKK